MTQNDLHSTEIHFRLLRSLAEISLRIPWATLSQAVRGMGIRRARYDGLPKVQLQHVLTAVAINLVRIDAVLTQTPRGKTRRSHFARLAWHPALQGSAAA